MIFGHDKIEILHLPTPLEHLKNVSDDLGINVYCKRDDLTNLATGGNKLRKLEYFLKDAMDKGATMLITEGGAQTNHGRLTAAVAAKYGMKCAIITADEYPGEISANLLLDGMMGCPVYFVSEMETGRQAVIDKNLLDAVIGLPANLFYGTSIPACILVFKKNRTTDNVVFIDASGKEDIMLELMAEGNGHTARRDIEENLARYQVAEYKELFLATKRNEAAILSRLMGEKDDFAMDMPLTLYSTLFTIFVPDS